MSDEVQKRKGRPPKAALAAVKARPVGRPKGTQAVINDFRDRMLMSPKSAKVLESIFSVALDTEHKHWAAAAKLVTDRIVPLSAFDPNSKGNGTMPQISINITGLNSPSVEMAEDVTDIDDNA